MGGRDEDVGCKPMSLMMKPVKILFPHTLNYMWKNQFSPYIYVYTKHG